MALTRNFLKSMGLTDEQVNAIIENHTETIEGLKNERDAYKLKADRADELEQQLTAANEKLANSGDAARVQQEFDDYKTAVEAEKTTAKKRDAMDVLLRDQVGIKRASARKLIIGAMDMTPYELENDQIKGSKTVAETLKKTYAEWIGESETNGVPPANPPAGGGAKMTKEEISKITDPAKLRAAIAENIELFK